MTTPIPVPGETELLITNNGSTVDTSPKVIVEVSFALPVDATLVLLRNGVETPATPLLIAPLTYQFTDNVATPGPCVYTVEVRQGARSQPSPAYNVVVENINQGWSTQVNQDGPYAIGNTGGTSNLEDAEWMDSFWLALIGNVKTTDVVLWQTEWDPGTDGDLPPLAVQHAATATQPHRLELRSRTGAKGLVSYSSGWLKITLLVNGVPRGNALELVLGDDLGSSSFMEGANWLIWVPPAPPASTLLSGSVTGLAVPYSGGIVWYRFVVPTTKPVEISTIGSTVDTEIAVYDAAGNLIDEDDSGGNDAYDTSLLRMRGLTVGETYYIAIGQYQCRFGPKRWQARKTGGVDTGQLLLNVNMEYEPVPMTYEFVGGEYAGGNFGFPSKGGFIHSFDNTSGEPLVVDVYGVVNVDLETNAPGTPYNVTPRFSRMLGGSILGYEFWEGGVLMDSAAWDPSDTAEQSVRAQSISDHLYRGKFPADDRFVRFMLGTNGYVEVFTVFEQTFDDAVFTGTWRGRTTARTPVTLVSKLNLTGLYVKEVPPVQSPFTTLQWDYSSSANGNIRTSDDLPAVYGAPTPEVERYFLKNNQDFQATAAILVAAGPNPVLQPGDTIVVQGVIHYIELTGNVEAESYVDGTFFPLTHSATTRLSGGFDDELQLIGEEGVSWSSLRSLCNYPDNLVARTFTVKTEPFIKPDGTCNFWYGAEFTLDKGNYDSLPAGYRTMATINGIAVYRGTVIPENLVYSDVNRKISSLDIELREDPNASLVQDFSVSPLSGVAPLDLTYQNLSNFTGTEIVYTVQGPQINADTSRIRMQGVYSIMQSQRRPDTNITTVTKNNLVTVLEKTYPAQPGYTELFRDEFNGPVGLVSNHVPDFNPSGATMLASGMALTGNGYMHNTNPSGNSGAVLEIARAHGAEFEVKFNWSVDMPGELPINGNLFLGIIYGDGTAQAIARLYRQSSSTYMRIAIVTDTIDVVSPVAVFNETFDGLGTLDCSFVMSHLGAIFKVNNTQTDNILPVPDFGNLTAVKLQDVVSGLYINRMQVLDTGPAVAPPPTPIDETVLLETFTGAAGAFTDRTPDIAGPGWTTTFSGGASFMRANTVIDGNGSLVVPYQNGNHSYAGGAVMQAPVDEATGIQLAGVGAGGAKRIETLITTGTAFKTNNYTVIAGIEIITGDAAGNSSSDGWMVMSRLLDGVTTQFEYSDQDNSYLEELPFVFELNTQYLIAVEIDGAFWRLYIDGVLIWTAEPAFVLTWPVINAAVNIHSGKIDYIKVTSAGTLGTQTTINETFDSFTGWTVEQSYTGSGAAAGVSGGVLAPTSYGDGPSWHGPKITKTFPAMQDFDITFEGVNFGDVPSDIVHCILSVGTNFAFSMSDAWDNGTAGLEGYSFVVSNNTGGVIEQSPNTSAETLNNAVIRLVREGSTFKGYVDNVLKMTATNVPTAPADFISITFAHFTAYPGGDMSLSGIKGQAVLA